jgi:NAD(P)H dehydrogenase (quinone)
MILITGAAGKTGKTVTRALAARGAEVRALIRRPEDAPVLAALGAHSVVSGDLRDLGDLRRGLAGAEAVYHICPNVHPDEYAIGQNVIAAARAEGVGRIVYHSVLHPQTEAMPHHWQKLRVEAALFEAGLNFTILQPAPYMENTLPAAARDGVLTVPYPLETRLSLVALGDVAEAAARVLGEPGHSSATYELAGTTPLSQSEVAEQLSAALGHPVRAAAESVAAWEARALAAGLGDYQRATLKAMFAYYASFGLGGSPNVLTWLLGRPPTTIAAFVERGLT